MSKSKQQIVNRKIALGNHQQTGNNDSDSDLEEILSSALLEEIDFSKVTSFNAPNIMNLM